MPTLDYIVRPCLKKRKKERNKKRKNQKPKNPPERLVK
jgi:hypothetical protein